MPLYDRNIRSPVSTYCVWFFLALGCSIMLKRLIPTPNFLSRSSIDFASKKNIKHPYSTMTDKIPITRLFYITVPSEEIAKKMASELVKNKLAACVNILPSVTSIYEWQGKIEQDEELSLIVKSTVENADKIKEFVKNNHPYDEPCLLSLPVDEKASSENFVDWIKKTAKPT